MKYLPISDWLAQLGLAEYCVLFQQYDGIENLLHLTEADLIKMGIENQVHRTHIISNIMLLQEVEKKKEPKMIAAGKFSSLPRNGAVNHQFSLASSMDLLTTKPLPTEHRTDSFQDISIHGTLPRKKKGTIPITRSCDMFSHMGTLPYTRTHRQQPPFVQDVIEEYPPQNGKSNKLHGRDQNILDPTLEYVKDKGLDYPSFGNKPFPPEADPAAIPHVWRTSASGCRGTQSGVREMDGGRHRNTGNQPCNRPEPAKAVWAVSENYLIIPGHMVCFILVAASWLHLLKLNQSPGLAAVYFLWAS